jgi:hypothetical protein
MLRGVEHWYPLKEGAFRSLISRAVSCATRFNGTILP